MLLLAYVVFVVATLALPAMILWDVLRNPEPGTCPIMVLTYGTDGRIISVPTTTYYQERPCVEPTIALSPAGATAFAAVFPAPTPYTRSATAVPD